MTTHFKAPMSYREIAERGTKMMDEGGHLVKVASILAEFEEATGRKLFVCEAAQHEQPDGNSLTREEMLRKLQAGDVMATAGAEDRYCADSAAGIYDQDMPAEMTGIAIEDAAQAEAEPIDPAPKRQNDYARPVDAQDAPVTAHAAPAQDAPAAVAKRPAQPAAPGVGRASFATAKPKAAAKPAAEDRPWGKLSLPEREIVKHLERLPKTFTPQDDLCLVELLTNGDKIDAAAAFLEVEPDAALTRWKSFLCEDVIGSNGKPTIDGQQRLINALRYRVEVAQ